MNNDIKFLNMERRTWYSFTNFEDQLDCMLQLFFRPQFVWFPSHLCIGVIPNSSGQLIGRTNYLYYSTGVDLYSRQILLSLLS